jgi:DNA-binding GntR family transcriptional regulator
MTDHQSGEPKMSDLLWQATGQFASAPNMLVDGVYETLWKQIVEGERQQGERLSDTDIAAELSVSRTPVRQALHQLQRAGLVQTSARRGFHVTIFTPEDIRELYDLRTILEVAAVHAAMARLEEARLRAALEGIGAIRAMLGTDVSTRFLHSDIELHHDLIAVGSGNRRLADAITTQRAQMAIFMVGGTRLNSWIAEALDDHEAIVRALLDRDVSAAAGAMERHIQTVKEKVLRQFVAPRRTIARSLRPAAVPGGNGTEA